MVVYIVSEICDYEYGCREIESVWATYEDAENHINELGNNEEIKFWNGTSSPYYQINSYIVNGTGVVFDKE